MEDIWWIQAVHYGCVVVTLCIALLGIGGEGTAWNKRKRGKDVFPVVGVLCENFWEKGDPVELKK